jgi:hypothetical protein
VSLHISSATTLAQNPTAKRGTSDRFSEASVNQIKANVRRNVKQTCVSGGTHLGGIVIAAPVSRGFNLVLNDPNTVNTATLKRRGTRRQETV